MIKKNVNEQLIELWPFFLKIVIPITIFFGIVSGYCLFNDVPFRLAINDPAAVAGIHPFTGIISNVGILLCAAASAIILFAWTLVRTSIDKQQRSFFLYGFMLNTLLLFDDFFMLHEYIFPIELGIPEKFVLLFYLIFVLSIFIHLIDYILITDFLILLLGICFIGISVSLDLLPQFLPFQGGFEDYFKLVGIGCWSLYFIRTSFQICQNKGELDGVGGEEV